MVLYLELKGRLSHLKLFVAIITHASKMTKYGEVES